MILEKYCPYCSFIVIISPSNNRLALNVKLSGTAIILSKLYGFRWISYIGSFADIIRTSICHFLLFLGPIKKWSDGPVTAPRTGFGPGPGPPSTVPSVPLASLIQIFVDEKFENKGEKEGEIGGEGDDKSPAGKF